LLNEQVLWACCHWPEELEGSRTVDQEWEVWNILIHTIHESSFCDFFGTEVGLKNAVLSRGSELLKNVCNLTHTKELILKICGGQKLFTT
jgi:hypothetical protein